MVTVVRNASSEVRQKAKRYSSGVHFDRFVELVGTRGSVVPLDEALAIICHFADPTINPSQVISDLDQLAEKTAATTATELMSELFGPSGFTGNTVSYDDPANSYLHLVLTRKLGIPITLCAVAMELSRRIGVDLIGVGMPGHFLCRSMDGDRQFFDPFHSPNPITAQDCRRLYENLTQLDNWSAEFLEPTDARMMVIRVLGNLKSIFRRRSDVANLRWVMRLRSVIPEISAVESVEFAQLVRHSN